MSFNKDTLGVHYHTWRNFISRESLKEKEAFNGDNPEAIPSPRILYRYQDHNFIQVVQPLQLFRPLTLAGKVKWVEKKNKFVPDPVPGGLKKIVQEAQKKGLKVKAVGSGHSFSDIATTSDFLVVTDDLNEMLVSPDLKNSSTLYGFGSAEEAAKRAALKTRINIRHYQHLKEYIKSKGYREFLKKPGDDMTWDKVGKGSRKFYGQPEDNPGLVEFEAGIKIEDLNDQLWDLSPGWSLYNMGTYQGQSFIGAAATSTHGSGHKLPPLPDMIKSMVLVADGGIIFRIEPTIGITSPGTAVSDKRLLPKSKGYAELVEKKKIFQTRENDVDFLIQDDDWFASALVNVGTFGIIYSVIIEVIPRYYLLETVEFSTWENVRIRLINQGKLIHRDALPTQLMLNDPDFGNKHEIFEEREFIASFPANKHFPCKGNEFDPQSNLKVSQIRQTTIEVHPHKFVDENGENGPHICRIMRQYKVEDTAFARRWSKKNKGRFADNNNPFSLKELSIAVTKIGLNMAAEGVVHDSSGQDKWYENNMYLTAVAILRPVSGAVFETVVAALFNSKRLTKEVVDNILEPFTCREHYLNRNYRTQFIPLFPGYGVELGFGTKESPVKKSLPAYVDAMDRILEMADEHWTEGRYMQSSPIAMRMVKASNSYLSMQYSENKEPTCMIELLNQMDTNGGKELFYRYERELFKYGARPHWGLDLSVTTGNNELLKKMYPKYNEWKKAYDAFNYAGTFNNRFTDRMGLSI